MSSSAELKRPQDLWNQSLEQKVITVLRIADYDQAVK